jgi:HTH-type transcriptional regulator/antitoxin HigA
MLIRPIRNEVDYEAALDEIAHYFEREPAPGTPEADRFDLLAMLIADYEREYWPIDPPEPIEAIQCYMEQRGYTQSDLAALLGSRSRASEILNRRRPLTMEMAWKLHRDWGLPAESLIRPYPTDAAPRSARSQGARSRPASRKPAAES